MSIANSIADVLEDLVARIRGGKSKQPEMHERYIMEFLSRPDPDKDGYQMKGVVSFNSMDKAVNRMAEGLTYNQSFVSLTREVTIAEDVTEEMKEKLRSRIPSQLSEKVRDIYPDWTSPVI